MPFGKYKDFADCVSKNQGMDDPEGYCAVIRRKILGKDESKKDMERMVVELAAGQKDGELVEVGMPYGGATTFEEAEQFNEASAKTAAADQVLYMAQDLGRNAIQRPDIPMEDKPSRLEQIAKGLAKRIGQVLTLGGDQSNKAAENRPPVEQVTSSLSFTKDRDGKLRWFGVASGNFKDREREVFPASVHQEFVDYMEKSGDFPELWLWHTPGTRFGKADWADFESGFMMYSGTVDPGQEFIAESLAAMKDLGMSHGFKFKYAEPGVIGFYRTYELSVLPLAHCAFPWTNFEVQQKERSMKPERLAFLEGALGKDKAAQKIAEVAALQKSLRDVGVQWKEFDPDPPAPVPTAEELIKAFKDTDEYKALSTIPAKVETMEKAQAEAMTGLLADVKALQDENAALKTENAAIKAQVSKTQDDLVSAALRPRGATQPASKSKDNLVPPSDPLNQAAPKLPVDAGLAASLGTVLGRG